MPGGTPSSTTSALAPLALEDWPLHPAVDEAERDLPKLRIASIAPSVTEILCALGLRGCIVGRTSYCDHPPDVAGVPVVGALLDLNIETLLAQRPDLVLVVGESRQTREKLAQVKLRCESVPDVSVDDLYASIEKIGSWTGRPRTAAALIAHLREDMERVAAHYRSSPPARVLVLTGVLSTPPSPPYVAGERSFYDWMLRQLGDVNVVAGHGAAFGPLSLEFIGQADPDVIVELAAEQRERPGGDADALRAWAELPGLRAVAAKRVRVLTGNRHYLLGPRLALTFRDLAEAIR